MSFCLLYQGCAWARSPCPVYDALHPFTKTVVGGDCLFPKFLPHRFIFPHSFSLQLVGASRLFLFSQLPSCRNCARVCSTISSSTTGTSLHLFFLRYLSGGIRKYQKIFLVTRVEASPSRHSTSPALPLISPDVQPPGPPGSFIFSTVVLALRLIFFPHAAWHPPSSVALSPPVRSTSLSNFLSCRFYFRCCFNLVLLAAIFLRTHPGTVFAKRDIQRFPWSGVCFSGQAVLSRIVFLLFLSDFFASESSKPDFHSFPLSPFLFPIGRVGTP